MAPGTGTRIGSIVLVPPLINSYQQAARLTRNVVVLRHYGVHYCISGAGCGRAPQTLNIVTALTQELEDGLPSPLSSIARELNSGISLRLLGIPTR